MPDPIIIITIASALIALPALVLAIWHAWKFECHRHLAEGASESLD